MAALQWAPARRVDRYVIHDKVASGGMGAVYLGLGPDARIVAIKRLHPHVAEAPSARAMFLDEARLSALICHPNIVATLDVAEQDGELLLVMEYVHGASLAFLERDACARTPPAVASAILLDVLIGLQAAHDATDERGAPLSIVHRDVSPQNVIVGEDGAARVLDFGIAQAAMRRQTTLDGQIKGKLRYLAREQILDQAACRKTDVYAAAVVLWELLTGRHLFDASNEGAILAKVLEGVVIPPRRISPDVPRALEDVVMRGLARRRDERFDSCRDMARALRAAMPPAHREQVGEFVRQRAGDLLRERAARIAQIEMGTVENTTRWAPSENSDSLTASVLRAVVPVLTQ